MEYELIEEDDIEYLVNEEDEETQEELPQKKHYIDNVKLTGDLNAWSVIVRQAKAESKPIPPIPRFVAQSIMDIADNLSTKHCYAGYSWIDEMKLDGIENCVKYIHNYNPDAVTRAGKPNAFGYISMIIERAFKGRIQHEKREVYFKNKSFELMGGIDALGEEDFDDIANGDSSRNALRDMIERSHEYETQMAEKKAKEKAKIIKPEPAHFNINSFLGD